MTRDEIIASRPLAEMLIGRGYYLRKSGEELVTNRCPIVPHKAGHYCVSINPLKNVWRCADCGQGGSIIDWLMHESGKPAGEILRELDPPVAISIVKKPTLSETYDYCDETGKLLYQVCRFEPKTFRQRQPDGKGGWIWNLDGISRVLFNLPAVLRSQSIVIVEGEKDCQSLARLGYTATTNAGGAGGWLEAYAAFLRGKDVILIPDSDPGGEKHAASVIASLEAVAGSVKRIRLPSPYKDVTDFVDSFPDEEKAKRELALLIDSTPHTINPIPIYTMLEMETCYREFVRSLSQRSFDLGQFLPDLRAHVERHLVPGELVLILANTGVGKSCLCQAIARSAVPLPTLFFELELPLSLMFERFVQMEVGCYAKDVEMDYRENEQSFLGHYKGLQHIFVCPESGLSTAQIESYILRSQLKIGSRPVLVIVDYIGLVRETGKSRYEMMSNAAEGLKVVAKRTDTIIIMASQIARPARDKKASLEVHLHDAKESGSLENSAGLVLGCWRPAKDEICLKILKNTKGSSGQTITARFDGSKMRIEPITL